jgi:hypothetical protein
MFMKRTEKQTY